MLIEAGFRDFPAAQDLEAPCIVKLGARRRDSKQIILNFEEASPLEVAQETLARVKMLIDRFENEWTPYASLLHPMFKGRRYGDYDHLARVREWSLGAENEE
jgi:ATP-dependent helicase/nuclease subunit B